MNKIKNKVIFITGGAGFIASHIVERLLEDNEIIIYDNYTRNSTCFDKILMNHRNLTAIDGDVLDLYHMCKSSRGADIIVHCAAIAGIYAVTDHLATTMKVNLIGSYNALEAAVKNKVKKFVDFSTSEVYGSFVYRGKESGNTIIGPIGERRWVYAVGKLASEHLSHSYGVEYGLDVVSVRPFNVYGPRQTGEGAIKQMVTRALKNEDITVYNDGVQIRAWCYISDFTDALYTILKSDKSNNNIFNIGNPQASITVLNLAKKIIDVCGSKSKIVFKKHPGTEIEVRVPNIEKAQELLGFEPKISLEAGLRKTIGWYKQNLENL